MIYRLYCRLAHVIAHFRHRNIRILANYDCYRSVTHKNYHRCVLFMRKRNEWHNIRMHKCYTHRPNIYHIHIISLICIIITSCMTNNINNIHSSSNNNNNKCNTASKNKNAARSDFELQQHLAPNTQQCLCCLLGRLWQEIVLLLKAKNNSPTSL